MARLTIAWANLLQGDRVGAGAEAQLALDALGATTQPWITHAGHRLLGVLATDTGQYDVALDHYRVALDMARAMGSLTDEGQTLARIATTQLLRGDHVEGLDSLERALAVSRRAGDKATAGDVSDRIEALRRADARVHPLSPARRDM